MGAVDTSSPGAPCVKEREGHTVREGEETLPSPGLPRHAGPPGPQPQALPSPGAVAAGAGWSWAGLLAPVLASPGGLLHQPPSRY